MSYSSKEEAWAFMWLDHEDLVLLCARSHRNRLLGTCFPPREHEDPCGAWVSQLVEDL